MDEKTVIEGLESLWKATFGDSSEYISLVFDNYFVPEKAFYIERNEEIVSGLLGVPYEFAPSDGKRLKGLYLCGLATRKDHRHRGFMSQLIEKANDKAMDAGYDFTFLIPTDALIRPYYEARGYVDAFFKIMERYVKGHRFGGEEEEVSVVAFDGAVKEDVLDFLMQNGDASYGRQGAYQLVHSRNDWETVLREAIISSDPVYIGKKGEKMVAMAFTTTEDGEITVKKMAVSAREYEKALLGGIASLNPGRNITVVRDLDEALSHPSSQLWSPFYAQNNAKTAEYEDVAMVEIPFNQSRNAYPFGMVRIFDLPSVLKKMGIDSSESLKGYSEKELLHLILRRPAGRQADALEQILDLPELSLNMSLMLE